MLPSPFLSGFGATRFSVFCLALAFPLLGCAPGGASSTQPLSVSTQATAATPSPTPATPSTRFEIVATYPHDAQAFTQGLLIDGGVFYESTGLPGRSSLRRVERKSGRVLSIRKNAPDVFAEGMALVGDELYQISWQNGKCFVYDKTTLRPKREYSYSGEGWGLTYDGTHLIMSDGSDTLFFRDPKTFQVVRTLRVSENGESVSQLNELEMVNGEIWANVWHSDSIVRIDAQSGKVRGFLDFSAHKPKLDNPEAVLNGIAYEAKSKRLFLTGKLWPKIYELRLLPAS